MLSLSEGVLCIYTTSQNRNLLHIYRRRTCVLSLYVIKSNDPSGGMKEIVRSFSNRANRTHLHKMPDIILELASRREKNARKKLYLILNSKWSICKDKKVGHTY